MSCASSKRYGRWGSNSTFTSRINLNNAGHVPVPELDGPDLAGGPTLPVLIEDDRQRWTPSRDDYVPWVYFKHVGCRQSGNFTHGGSIWIARRSREKVARW